jgi:hypothetical protein
VTRTHESLIAKDAKDAKEEKSFTAKDAKDAKESINRDLGLHPLIIVISFATLASLAVKLLFSFVPFAILAVRL